MIKLFENILDIIYPKSCGLCGGLLDFGSGNVLCKDCNRRLEKADFPFKSSSGGISLFPYSGEIRKRIIELKYDGRTELCSLFGFLMAEAFKKSGLTADFDEVLAVPASKKGFKARGYNQAELMAQEVGRYLNIPTGSELVRIKETLPQNKLDQSKRAENIKGAFGVTGDLRNKKILLIDDIYTTGSTINECKRTLMSAGAESIFYITAAKTVLHNDN
ncbi:MAG: ComF family protein [Clostridiales bacterium]|nr:ComF family protein [Clostridiales bacterium]